MRLKKKYDMTTMTGTTMIDRKASRYVEPRDHDEIDGEQQDDAADAQRLLRVETTQRVDIRGAALDQLARLHPVVIAEGQPLNVIVQVVPQAPRDAFGGLRGEPAAHEGEPALQQGQPDERQRDQREGERRALLAEHVVDKVPEQQVRGRFGAGADAQGHGRGQKTPAETGHHGPEAGQAVGGDGVLQVIFEGGQRRLSHRCHRIAPRESRVAR